MIEIDTRRTALNNRGTRDEWLADLAGIGGNRNVYADRREPAGLGSSGVLGSQETGMTGRYDQDGQHSGETSYKAAGEHAGQTYDDASNQDDLEDEPHWTFDEKLQAWIDRDGNPYVEPSAEEEEARYAPYVEDEYLAQNADARLPQPRRRSYLGSVAALVIIACIGGGVAYKWKHGGFVGSALPGLGSAPPVIKASTDPVKIKPAETAVAENPTQEIFNRAGQANAVQNEHIVPHEEQPVAVVPVRTDPVTVVPPAADAGGAPTGQAASDATQTNTAAANPDGNPPAATPSRAVSTSNITLPATGNDAADAPAGDEPQGPRRVRTIKITGDTAVTGDAPITGSDPAPVASQAVTVAPAVTSAQQGSGEAAAQLQGSAVDIAGGTSVASIAPPAAAPVAQDAAPAVNDGGGGADNAAAADQSAPPVAETVPTAMPPVRPRNIPAAAPVHATQVASADPMPTSAGGGYVVQVSSQKTPADAQTAFQALQRKFPSVMTGLKPSVKKVELADRGTFYRVRVGTWATSAEATSFCSKLKAAGGDCVIARN